MHYSRESSSLGLQIKKKKKYPIEDNRRRFKEDLKKIEKDEKKLLFFFFQNWCNDIFFYLSLVLINEILGYEIFIDKAAACRIWNSIMFFGEWNIFEVFFEYFTNSFVTLLWIFFYLIKKII